MKNAYKSMYIVTIFPFLTKGLVEVHLAVFCMFTEQFLFSLKSTKSTWFHWWWWDTWTFTL